ncbi:hypothetical protein ACGFK1_20205 [Mycobacterium sp. NPDC048908]|uniref:hypothetical protein n=1 Tax=Mycobacterium sp. NPDC048908 TaxID=3364292 RepID=UPI0037209091
MNPHKRRFTRVARRAAIVAMIVITAGCAHTNTPTPTTTPPTTTTPSTTASPAPPTEKNINPTSGNMFTPQVIAPAAPTEPPGVHRHRRG